MLFTCSIGDTASLPFFIGTHISCTGRRSSSMTVASGSLVSLSLFILLFAIECTRCIIQCHVIASMIMLRNLILRLSSCVGYSCLYYVLVFCICHDHAS